jgi:molecular chaperone GrpE (heat shock protein)
MDPEDKKTDDTTKTDDATGKDQGGDKKGGDPNSKTFTQAEMDAVVEARLKREKEKAEKQAQKAREEAEAAALKSQGEFKTLAEKQAKQLAEYEPLAEQVKTAQANLERYTAALAQYRDAQFQKIPAPIKVLLEKMDVVDQLKWLADNAATLTGSKSVDINASAGGKQEPDLKAREAELKRRARL